MPYPDLYLVSHRLCPELEFLRIVMVEKQIPHRVEFIDVTGKPDPFLILSPLGKVPMLCVDDVPLFGCYAIAEYLDEISPGSLYPRDVLARAMNRSWIEFAAETLAAIAVFYGAKSTLEFLHATQSLQQRFLRLENELGRGPWFNGEQFSLVDAAFAPVFRYFNVSESLSEFGFFDGLGRIPAWRSALEARPSIRIAVVDDYHERLRTFFLGLDSELGRLVEAADFLTDDPTIN